MQAHILSGNLPFRPQEIIRQFHAENPVMVRVHEQICLPAFLLFYEVKIAHLFPERTVIFYRHLIGTQESLRLQKDEAGLFAGKLYPADIFPRLRTLQDMRTVHTGRRIKV